MGPRLTVRRHYHPLLLQGIEAQFGVSGGWPEIARVDLGMATGGSVVEVDQGATVGQAGRTLGHGVGVHQC